MDSPPPPRDRRGMRTGFTTGTNAAAAARAATLALLSGTWPAAVTVSLPSGETTQMVPVETYLDAQCATCCMQKDGGDDPDVTHGALICATVRHTQQPGIWLEGGQGVGRVTLPGLGLPVGEAAINPVPRQQIHANVLAALESLMPDAADYLAHHGLLVEISVPEGERLAQRTLNPRLGIVGGISILGTSGKVYPYSTAAWRASVEQAVQLGAYHSPAHLVLATGARSEQYAQQIYPQLPELAFVEISIFTGVALRACVQQGVGKASLVAMISRIVKTAQGRMVTHVAGNPVDFAFLAQVCTEAGASPELVAAVANANTARHVLELCQTHRDMAPIERLTDLALTQSQRFVQRLGGQLALEVVLVDFAGGVLVVRQGHG
ncbi:MAG: cobalt-precorrin-5B (C(1))-methyltransferase [Candidatus Viridilinea halotolerans]|uniref:Cobalt-precorrin-5B C(1)-methyltransferase n=1 Tax=Candidatus Viridilinea halotolerans TaxID=2491704 RepID=A0A426TRP2_9CHLR|nr:MAG: cobalt-precorrin-5B (C(1))-methyltransferase [Candidatus Viridilinea halotolerans]